MMYGDTVFCFAIYAKTECQYQNFYQVAEVYNTDDIKNQLDITFQRSGCAICCVSDVLQASGKRIPGTDEQVDPISLLRYIRNDTSLITSSNLMYIRKVLSKFNVQSERIMSPTKEMLKEILENGSQIILRVPSQRGGHYQIVNAVDYENKLLMLKNPGSKWAVNQQMKFDVFDNYSNPIREQPIEESKDLRLIETSKPDSVSLQSNQLQIQGIQEPCEVKCKESDVSGIESVLRDSNNLLTILNVDTDFIKIITETQNRCSIDRNFDTGQTTQHNITDSN
eukprot:403356806